MHLLPIGDPWWFNFLNETSAEIINDDDALIAEFARWGAELRVNTFDYDSYELDLEAIAFRNERDITLFLLRWS